jgi:FkbM family methyltransferase
MKRALNLILGALCVFGTLFVILNVLPLRVEIPASQNDIQVSQTKIREYEQKIEQLEQQMKDQSAQQVKKIGKSVIYHSKDQKITCEKNGQEIQCPFSAQSQEDVDVLTYMFKTLSSGKSNDNVEFPLKGPMHSILEIGALDGLMLSTTKFFEDMLDWRAIHFEGARENFKNLIINRPKSLNVHLAACEKEGKITFVDHGAVGGIVEDMSNKFKENWHPNGAERNQYEVDCVPMSKYLTIFGISKIDVFVLDVEGGELDVLKGLDLNVTQVHFFIIEEDHTDVPREENIKGILKQHGFKSVGTIGQGRNGFYQNMNWKE